MRRALALAIALGATWVMVENTQAMEDVATGRWITRDPLYYSPQSVQKPKKLTKGDYLLHGASLKHAKYMPRGVTGHLFVAMNANAVNLHDSTGMCSSSWAEDQMSGGDQWASQIANAIFESNCPLPQINCVCCMNSSYEAGQFDPGSNSLNLCMDQFGNNTESDLTTVRHELWHALQWCNLDDYNFLPPPQMHAYREFESYYLWDCNGSCNCAETGSNSSCGQYCDNPTYQDGIDRARSDFGCN